MQSRAYLPVNNGLDGPRYSCQYAPNHTCMSPEEERTFRENVVSVDFVLDVCTLVIDDAKIAPSSDSEWIGFLGNGRDDREI